MKHLNLLAALMALCVWTSVFAQGPSITGTVVDESGYPIIGAGVFQKGHEENGTTTDLDGNFSISCAPGETLVVSFIGMVTQEVNAVPGGMRVVLAEDSELLDEIVVVGYGVQKKSVVTASIAKVSSDDLEGKTRLRAEDALKGLAAGISVTSSSGQPGAKSMIRVRGIGTINDSEPLYIIDGMPTDQDGMESVNPNDIESIEVLKDAASGAIYGARAANGVILITTKKGEKGNAKINYNFSYGWQSAWRKRDVTGATDYAILMNEKYINGGQDPIYADPYNLVDANGNAVTGFGTDWQEEVFNDGAPIMQHDLSISGATDKINYYFSIGYFTQDGIVGGNYGQSNYDRVTIRSNNTYTVFDDENERTFLNRLDVGLNVSYMIVNNTSITANSTYGSVLGSALYLSPILPVTLTGDAAQGMIDQYSDYDLFYDENGNPYTIPGYLGSYQEMNNPVAMLQTYPTKNWSQKIMPKLSADLQIWDKIKYHFTFSAEQSFYGNRGATLQKYYLSGNNNSDHTAASVYKGNCYTWQVENTLTYDNTFGKHTIGIVLGQSALAYGGDDLSGSHWNLVNTEKPYISYTTGGNYSTTLDADGNITGVTSLITVGGGPYVKHRLSSLFFRASYDYDERYMAQVTVRRDGSSRFGSNNKYGIFPSVSAGWNVMNEKFMDNTKRWLSNLKVRASWGKNGNDNIGDFAYTTLTTTGGTSNYYFGTSNTMYYGSKANQLANEDLQWEESEQTDIGLDFGFFKSSLTLSMDYYIKKTNGMIIEMPIPSYVGESKPLGNVGTMKNSGLEIEAGYKWNIGDASFNLSGNVTYLHNELTNLGNETGYLLYGINGFSDGGVRAENGQPFPYFYGYKTAGVFQNQQEVLDYVDANGNVIMPDAEPGDLRFVDVNGDGQITSDDRTNIGNGTPKWSYGFNLAVDFKGFDLSLFFQGVAGVDVFDATYRQDVASGNFPTWVLDRWTGEGTSNTVPILKLGDSKNWVISDLYVQDGSYLRLKNLTFGYTLPRKITEKVKISRLRVYFCAENLFTWTKYWGYDPEIGTSSTSLGVDYGVYPQARTFSVGCNLSF